MAKAPAFQFNTAKAIPPIVVCPAKLFILERMVGPDWCGPTPNAGVYVVCLRTANPKRKGAPCERVMYVGSSGNIRDRVHNRHHPLMVLREQYEWPVSVYVRTLECSDYREKEIQFIRLFRPPMNLQHNG